MTRLVPGGKDFIYAQKFMEEQIRADLTSTRDILAECNRLLHVKPDLAKELIGKFLDDRLWELKNKK